MKKIYLSLLWLVLSFQLMAQDLSYAGPAKSALKNFWMHIEKLKAGTGTPSSLTNAERMLQQVKEKDPGYNVAPLEAELKIQKDKSAKAANEKNDAQAKEEETQNYYKNLWMKMIGVYSSGNNIELGINGKNYYDRVIALNLEEYKEKRKALGNVEPKSFPGQIDALLADYNNYLKRSDRLRWNVVEPMTKSKNIANPQQKMALLRDVQYECEAVLILSPDHPDFTQKLADVKKLMGNADAEAAKFYTSDFHKEHVNQIVWSNQPLVIGKEKEMAASIKTDFAGNEPIFGTLYLGVLAKQLLNGNDRVQVKIKIDGGTAVWGGDLSNFIIPLAVQDKSYIQFALLPDSKWMAANYAPYIARENWTYSYFFDDLASSGDIKHTISFEMDFHNSILHLPKSNLTIDLNSGMAEIKAQSVKLHDQLMASRQLPKAGMSNPGIEQQMVAAANNLGWNDKFQKAIITSTSWNIEKNSITGVILYRYLAAVCTTKSSDGKCYTQEFSFRQDYSGNGNYESKIKYNSYGGKREIGCDKLK